MSPLHEFAFFHGLEVKGDKIEGPNGFISQLPLKGPQRLEFHVSGKTPVAFSENSPRSCETALQAIGLKPQVRQKVEIRRRYSTGTYLVFLDGEVLVDLRDKHHAVRLAKNLRSKLEGK